jgi:L-malate glycosyltransferase
MMKKKVLILPSWYPSEDSPISGIFIQNQVEEMVKKYDVSVLYPRWVGHREILKGKGKIGPRSQVEQQGGLTIYRERVFVPVTRRSRLAYRNYYRAVRRGFEKLLKGWGKPDMIHAHVVLPGGLAAVKLGKRFSIPVVLTEHTGPFSIHLRTGYHQKMVRAVLSRVSRIIAVSPELVKQMLAFQNGLKINIVGNLIRTDFFKPLRDEKEHPPSITRFLSIAFLRPQKGLSYLLEACHLLMNRGISLFELVIGGDGPERPNLERLAESLSLPNRCTFLGLLSQSQVRDWIQRCDVFVHPSLYETFGMVIGEAMACGKPVIATHCGGPEFIVTPETGILVNTGDAYDLANAMEKFISRQVQYDPEVVRQSIADRFGGNTFLNKISAIYEQVWKEQG